jgi:hypothetical protein
MILPENTTVDTGDVDAMAVHGLKPFKASDRPIVQNLGPGTLYLGTSAAGIATKGLELPTLAVYELPATLVEGAGRIYLRAVGDDCDVRIINVG